jgi:hypothetical protein
MYKIIGGDGQEYGPVTEEDLRKWIAEGRLSAQSLAKAESDAEFRPLSTFPEFAGELGAALAAHGGSSSMGREVDWSSRDYELDIGGCISRGWNLFANHLGILVGSCALCLVLIVIVFSLLGTIAGVIANGFFSVDVRVSPAFQIVQSCLINIVAALVVGPLTGGLYHVFIQTVRGRPPGIGELFLGFQNGFSQLFIGNVVMALTYVVCFLPATIVEMSRMAPVLALSEQMKHGTATPQQAQEMFSQMLSVFTSCAPIFLVCFVPWFYVFTNFQFTLPLIIDKKMDFWTAIKASWRMVHKHWFSVFGLIFLISLINIGGFCLCCIGLLFTFAFTTAACMFAYETIFGESRSV